MKPDSDLPPSDVWVWKEMGIAATALTGSPLYSCYEDFTWDKKDACMSGASDDYMYDHVGVFSFTTEFWDIVYQATGERASTKIWTLGPTVEQELAIAKWADVNAPGSYAHWRTFQHPQLGEVELGGADYFNLTTNPPAHLMLDEVKGHAEFALHQAMLSPKLEIITATAELVCVYHAIAADVVVESGNKGSYPTTPDKTGEKDKSLPGRGSPPMEPLATADDADGTSPAVVKGVKKSWNEYALGLVETIASPPLPPKPKPQQYIWRIKVGVANTGFLPTNVSEMANKIKAVLPVEVGLYPSDCIASPLSSRQQLLPADGHSPLRTTVGQLSGRLSTRVQWRGCDGTPDRALCTWLVIAPSDMPGIHVIATHPRAGQSVAYIALKK